MTPAELADDDPVVVVVRRIVDRVLRRVVIPLAAGLVALAVIVVVLIALVVGQRHRDDRQAADQTAARRGSCHQFNINQSNTREAMIGGLVETFRPLVQPGHEAELDSFAASLRVQVEQRLPYRDCTDTGIAAYLEHPPPDPALGG